VFQSTRLRQWEQGSQCTPATHQFQSHPMAHYTRFFGYTFHMTAITLDTLKVDMAVAKAREAEPERILEFIVDVTFDPESGYYMAVCDAIGLVTEAPTHDALQERVMLIAEELAVENGVMKRGESAVFTFAERQIA
jgi:hypothetical protein